MTAVSVVQQADERLAAADPAIPGIGAVLSPLDLVRRLGRDVTDARAVYLRYKPGTSLAVSLVLTSPDGGTSFAQALAVGPGSGAKLAKLAAAGEDDDVGHGVALDEDLGVGLADVTADRHLPGIRRVLRRAAADDRRTVVPLVYKPARRWVARLDVATGAGPGDCPGDGDGDGADGAGLTGTDWTGPDDGATGVEATGVEATGVEGAGTRSGTHGAATRRLVKVHRPGTLDAVLAGHAALAGLPVPALRRVHQRTGTVTSEWVDGTPLDQLHGPATVDATRRAGALVAAVHRRPAPAGLGGFDLGRDLTESVDAVRAVLPGAADVAGAVAERLLDRLAGGPAAVVHGDLSADQLVVDVGGGPRHVSLLDLDRVRSDDPMSDLGSWYGAHAAAVARTGGRAEDPEEVLAHLLAGYRDAGGVVDPVRLRDQCAAAVLRRASEPFRTHAPDWPDGVARLVRLAASLVAA